MNKLASVCVLATVVAFAPAARGEESGMTVGLRAAYGIPFGTAGDKVSLADQTSGAVPFQLDLGYRFDRRWNAGAYFSYGFAMIADPAKSGLAATGATDIGGHAIMRAGLQGTYTILPDARVAPWVGLAVGYEWTRYASAKLAGTTSSTEIGLRGLEASVQLGGDYKLARTVAVGPFASFGIGRYDHSISGSNSSIDIGDKSVHEWLQLGFRATYDF